MTEHLELLKKGLKEGFLLPRTEQMQEFIAFLSNDEGIIFTDTHGHGDTSCNTFLFYRWISMVKNSNRIYLPVHVVVFLMRVRRCKDTKERLTALKKFLEGWIRSLIFASFYGITGPMCGCYYTKFLGRANPNFAFWIIGLFSANILFETPSRWGEMSIYVLANWFEGYTYSLRKR